MRRIWLIAATATLAAGAPSIAKKTLNPSGLELQQLQSRDFEADKDMVFGAVMSVLQDSGYRIQAADKDTGLITGVASTKAKTTFVPFVGFGKSKKSPIVSAFIENSAPGHVRARLSFVLAKVKSNGYGAGPEDEEPIYDPSVYKDAFEKIEQAIFIRKGMAAPTTTALPVAPIAPAPTPVAAIPSSAPAPTIK